MTLIVGAERATSGVAMSRPRRRQQSPRRKAVVLICAEAEWALTRAHVRPRRTGRSPFGEWFYWRDDPAVISAYSGCGKTLAAAATQYVIDRWNPRLLLNLGTCGGLASSSTRIGQVILVTRTVVYDLKERGGGQTAMVASHTTDLDLTWLGQPWPLQPIKGVMATADQDLDPAHIPYLRRLGAVAADWESGAVAMVAQALNRRRCLIARAVSDVGGRPLTASLFRRRVEEVLPPLLDSLPAWLEGARA